MSPAPGNEAIVAAAILLVAALAAGWAVSERTARRRWADILVQPLVALLLYLALFPPLFREVSSTLTVLTPGASPHAALSWREAVVALPGAEAPARIERVPDLDTALRRYTGVSALRVLGGGLPARDRERLGPLGVQFETRAAEGFLDLEFPDRVRVGAQWMLSGAVAWPGARLELKDPSGALIDATVADPQGRFQLHGLARAAGTATFGLSLLDARPEQADSAAIPVLALAGESLDVILRVGAPDPEFKYWRRWAADAGLHLAVRAGLSEGMALRDGDTELTPQALAASDLVILDERAWASLAPAEKTALDAAVQDGLGLLLRADGPIPPAVATDWSEWGFASGAADTRAVTLDRRLGLHDRANFTAAPASIEAAGASPLLVADDGSALAWWRPRGRGRVGLWGLLDSYRLVLAGESARYGTLWSESVSRLARPRKPVVALPRIPAESWSGERLIACGLGRAATVLAPNGASRPLLIDARGCAADWPDAAGWHQLQSDGLSTPFYVRAVDDARSCVAPSTALPPVHWSGRQRRRPLRRPPACSHCRAGRFSSPGWLPAP